MKLIRIHKIVTLAFFVAFAAAAPAQEVYMSGLANPRRLTFDADGTLLVAEAGSGGLTGGISARKGADAQTRLLSNLPSTAAPDGSDSVGPSDVRRAADGRLAVLFGLGAGPDERDALGTGYERLATLSLYDAATKKWETRNDFAVREGAENPDGGEINSNPYSFVEDGTGYAVADAGANVVWRDGGSTLFTPQLVPGPGDPLPDPFPMDAVPTSVIARPGGGFMVGELGGFPFYKGYSRLYTLDADGKIVGTRAGFTTILDMAYAPDGSLLLAEYTTNGLTSGSPLGAIKRLRADGTIDTLISGLITPTSLAFGDDGLLYVAAQDATLGGVVLRYAYAPVPEPATFAALAVGWVALARRRRTA